MAGIETELSRAALLSYYSFSRRFSRCPLACPRLSRKLRGKKKEQVLPRLFARPQLPRAWNRLAVLLLTERLELATPAIPALPVKPDENGFYSLREPRKDTIDA